jgi:Dna[CI] antecedent, DciA
VIPTGSSLDKIVSGALRHAAPEQTPVLAWPLACGSSVAARTRVLDFSDGVLRVQVADAGWKRELQSLAPRYVAMLNRYASRKVERVEFVVTADRRIQSQNKEQRK